MTSRPFCFWLLLFVILFDKGDNDFIHFNQSGAFCELLAGDTEKKSTQTEGTCPVSLVFASDWKGVVNPSTVAEHLLPAQQAPFERSRFSSFNPCRHQRSNDEETPVMAMCPMLRGDEGNIPTVLEMRHGMAQLQRRRFCTSRGQTSLRAAVWTTAIMAGQIMDFTGLWFTESTHQRAQELQPWSSTWRRSGLLSSERLWKRTGLTSSSSTHDAYDDAISAADDCSPYAAASVGQGHGQRPSIYGDDGASAATNASHIWLADVISYHYSMGAYFADDADTSCSCESNDFNIHRRAHQGRPSPAKAEPPLERNEKRRRQPAFEPAVYGARNEETGRKKQYAKFALGSPCTWQEQGRLARSRKRQGTIACTVEELSTAISDPVERFHQKLSSLGRSPPGLCEGSSDRSSQSPKRLRCCFKERTARKGRSPTNLGRRRRDRDHRGDECGRKGREFTEDSRGHEFHCHQLGGVIIVGGPLRTESQEATHSSWRIDLLVFWQGRRCMTNVYTRQGPELPPETSMDCASAQWYHSIMLEDDFLSVRQAQVFASTLASALGFADKTVEDAFVLPLRNKVQRHRVSFKDEVTVFIGNEQDNLFAEITVHHDSLSPWPGKPWTVRALPVLDHGHDFQEGDSISFMARRPSPRHRAEGDCSSSSTSATTHSSSSRSSRTADWRQTVLLLLDGRMLPARLPWNDGDELINQITRIANIGHQGLLGLHFVSIRPRDLVQQDLQCLLVQTGADRRPSLFMRLILIDLEIFEPNEVLPGTFRRFIKWMPMTLNRVSAFRLLELEQLMTDHREDARLWHNQAIVPDGQVTPMHLEDGDYLKILIGRSQTLSCSASDQSSFYEENASAVEDWDSLSLFQLSAMQSQTPVDVDPLSNTAVCISDRRFPYFSMPTYASSGAPLSFPGGSSDNAPSSSPQYDGPGRPPRVERPTWYQEIWDILCTSGATELEEEGPVIYINSFYISHARHPKMTFARPLRFDAEHDLWEEDIKFMWEDYFDRSATFDLIVVRPDPPVTIYQGTVATVLIVQHPNPQKAACVVTALPETQDIRHVSTVALSLDLFVMPSELFVAANVDDICRHSQCKTFIGRQEMPADAALRIHDGLGLQIQFPVERIVQDPRSTELIRSTLAPPAGSSPHQDPPEDSDDLQLFTHRTTVSPIPSNGKCHRLNEEHFSSESFDFMIPLPEAMHHPGEPPSMNLDTLQEAWFQASTIFATSAEEASVTFAFWYLDGTRWPACDQPRLITLPPSIEQWEQLIRRLWNDRIQRGSRLFIDSFHPQPQDDAVAGHFLLHQSLNARSAGVLLSVFSHADTSHMHQRRAVIDHCRTFLPNLWRLTDFAEQCQTRELLCVGFRGSQSIMTGTEVHLRTGDHIELHVACWSVVHDRHLEDDH